MGNDTYIKYFDYYLPENFITVDQVFEHIDHRYFERKNIDRDTFCSKFKKDTKLNKIAAFKDEDNLAEIVYSMVDQFLKKTQINPQEIDYLVCGNEILLKYNCTSIMHYIQKVFHFDHSTILPLLQPCAASLFAMGLSSSLLAHEKKNMLVLTACQWASPEERFIDFTVRGDGVGLLWVGKDYGLLKIAGWHSCNLGNPSYNKIENKSQSTDFRTDMITRGVAFIEESLKKFNLKKDQIQKIIPPNVRYDVFFDVYSYYLKIRPELFYLENVSDGGHVCDIDMIRNIQTYLENEERAGDANIVLYTPDVEKSFDVNYHFLLLTEAI